MLITLFLIYAVFFNTEIIFPKYNSLFNKEKPVYPCAHKLIKNMNIDELKLVREYAKTIQDNELVFKTYYHLINLTTKHEEIKTYKLELADYCFQMENYTKASIVYEEFCILYPGSQESEYTQYKLILCTFNLSLSADRDQSLTHKVINLIEVFLTRAKNQKFIDETKTIFNTCKKRLFEHEAFVFETYIKQQKFIGAQKRLEYIEQKFQDIPNFDFYVTYLKNILELTKNPKTRPFKIHFDINNALIKTEKKVHSSAIKRAISFFVA